MRQSAFLEVQGTGVCEVPVGPVHAGVIEPGHFRFSVIGDSVLHLQLRLFYTHKGTEKLFEGSLANEAVRLLRNRFRETTALRTRLPTAWHLKGSLEFMCHGAPKPFVSSAWN